MIDNLEEKKIFEKGIYIGSIKKMSDMNKYRIERGEYHSKSFNDTELMSFLKMRKLEMK